MYKDSSIPANFNKIAEISDNFVVWVKEAKLNSGTSYAAYYQFFSPSVWVISTDDYKIKNGDSYILDANYTNNGMYSYIDNYDVSYSLTTLEVDDEYFGTSEYDRADFLNIFVVQFLIVLIFLWVFKNLSRLFVKGGLS